MELEYKFGFLIGFVGRALAFGFQSSEKEFVTISHLWQPCTYKSGSTYSTPANAVKHSKVSLNCEKIENKDFSSEFVCSNLLSMYASLRSDLRFLFSTVSTV